MAKNVDKDDGEPDGIKPSGVPPLGAKPEPKPEPLPDGFLPEDSFLLDLDDEGARAPAPTIEPAGASEPANEEWLLVDDDEAVAASAPAMPAEVQKAEPAPLEVTPDEAVAASSAGAAPATKVPSWYNEDDAELPKFVAEESEESAAAAAGATAGATGASASPAEPVLAMPAPVIPLARARRKRQLVAAAGLLITLGAASYWYFAMRGEDDGGATEVAVNLPPKPRPTPAPPKPEPAPELVTPAPEPEPEPEPVMPPEPEPVAVAPEIATPAPPVEVQTPAKTGPTVLESGRKRPLPPLTKEGWNKGTAANKDDVIVELRNGNTFRGQITRTKGSRVTLKIGAGECVFELSEVTLLDSSAPEYRRIDQMPEASVVLTSGAHLRGRLMKQNAEHVVLVINNGQVVFDRSDVKNVSFTGRIHF